MHEGSLASALDALNDALLRGLKLPHAERDKGEDGDVRSHRRLAALAASLLTVLNAQATMTLDGSVAPVAGVTPIIDRPTTNYHVLRAGKAPAIDGETDEWREVPATVLNAQAQAKGKWDGPADLSGSLRLLWDEESLYFCLEVRDDVHTARAPGPKQFPWDADGWWANDSFQCTFDAYMNGPAASYGGGFAKDGYDEDELTFCVSDSTNGPVMVSPRQRGDTRDNERVLPGFDLRMSVRPDGTRVYEWAMPWSRLEPVSPWILGRCGFSFALNDNDGKGFEGGLLWTRGVTFGQDASQLGQLVFDQAAGTRGAMLPLRPEPALLAATNSSRWLNLEGVEPHDTARLLVRPAKPGAVKATLTVTRSGESAPVARGRIEHRSGTECADAFVWDLSALGNGRYDLAFDVTGVKPGPGSRLSHRHWSSRGIEALASRREELRKRFALDAPWDELSSAPGLIQRHRGMVAAVLQWLELAKARSSAGGASGPEGREYAGADRLKALSDGAEMIAALDAGRDYLGERRNEFWAAYYSPADGRGQQFVMRVPADFDPRKSYPLVVWLHGSNGRPAPDADYVHNARYIEVRPWGRGDNSFTGLGEDDVFRAMEYAMRWYRIDPTRVYVTGRSMGGIGAWGVAARNPDRFAASAPICGLAYGLPLENLRSVPILNQHGLEDWRLAIDHSRFAVSAIQQLGYPVLHKEIPGWGHEITTAPPLYPVYDWLLTHRIEDRPTAITYTCDTPDHGRAYWLAVREVSDPHLRARVDARLSGSGLHQSLALRAENVDVLELDVSRMPVQRSADLLIQADYSLLTAKAPLPDRLFVLRKDDGWAGADQWAPQAAAARPYRAGAAADLYTGEPLLVVYGTQAGTNRTALLQRAAESAAGTAWSSHTVNGRFPAKADRDVTADDLQRFNLILIGSARDNSLVARMADRLPVRINASHELLAGTREPVSLAGAGFRLAYYNPLNPKRLIFIVTTDENGEAADRWFGDARRLVTGMSGQDRVDQPDLVVQSLVGPVRRLMQFTHGWQWDEVPGADARLPEAMASAESLQKATLRVMRSTTAADFSMGFGSQRGETPFDSRWFALADQATARTPGQTLLCRMSGQELAEIHRRWAASNEVVVVPSIDLEGVDTSRVYRVAMQPDLCGMLARGWKRNLRNVEAGPEWRQEGLWAEIFGEDAARRADRPRSISALGPRP